jgi:gas vesicle protein
MKRLFGFLFSAFLGTLYGLFFAQKSGRKLRMELKKSATPGRDLLNELKVVASESGKEAVDWAENSEELQRLLEEARAYFDELLKKSKDMTDTTAEYLGEEFEELSERAAAAAKKVKESATKKVSKFKNELEKEVKSVTKNK